MTAAWLATPQHTDPAHSRETHGMKLTAQPFLKDAESTHCCDVPGGVGGGTGKEDEEWQSGSSAIGLSV